MTIETLEAGGIPLRRCRPTTEVRSGVVVLHQAPGYTPQIEEWLIRLAQNGYLAIAPLLLHSRGVEAVDPVARFGGDLTAFAAFLPGDQELLSDISAAIRVLRASGIPDANIGMVGFSYGGRAAYLVAAEVPLGAAVTFYGNGIQRYGYPGNDNLPTLSDRAARLQTPWLGLYGEQDFLLAPGELDQFEVSLKEAPVPAQLVRYPDAGHAFDVEMAFGPGGPNSLVPEAASDAQLRTLAFLQSHLDESRS